jgi:hypothetical protein
MACVQAPSSNDVATMDATRSTRTSQHGSEGPCSDDVTCLYVRTRTPGEPAEAAP